MATISSDTILESRLAKSSLRLGGSQFEKNSQEKVSGD